MLSFSIVFLTTIITAFGKPIPDGLDAPDTGTEILSDSQIDPIENLVETTGNPAASEYPNDSIYADCSSESSTNELIGGNIGMNDDHNILRRQANSCPTNGYREHHKENSEVKKTTSSLEQEPPTNNIKTNIAALRRRCPNEKPHMLSCSGPEVWIEALTVITFVLNCVPGINSQESQHR